MAISRSSDSAVHRAGRWVGWLLVLGLTACRVTERGAANQTPAAESRASAPKPQESTETPESSSSARPLGTPDTRTVHRATPAATTTTAAVLAWQTYHSVQGNYTIEYPATWIINEQSGTAGAVARFTSSVGGAEIIITVRPTNPTQQEPLDVPNTRCQPVLGNRGIATRCLDTIARSTTTTFVGQNRAYTITIAGKGMDENIYQHMLDSFAPDAPTAAGQNQAAHQPQNDLARPAWITPHRSSSTSSAHLIGEARPTVASHLQAPDELAHRLDERYTDPRQVLALTLVVLLALETRTAIASISLYHRMVLRQHDARQATRRRSV
jgi:hypothetical protein